MYRLEVCLVSLYMLRMSVGVCLKVEMTELLPGLSPGNATGKQANECLKRKPGEEGRRPGFGSWDDA